MVLHALLQPCFYFWPLFDDDAEPMGVAGAAVVHDDVVAEDAFRFCAERLNGGLRFQIVVVSFEDDTAGAHRFEGMGQLQVLGFDIDAVPLISGIEPGPANFECSVFDLNVAEASGADDAVVMERARRPGQDGARGCAIETRFDVTAQVALGSHRLIPPVPDLLILSSLDQCGEMLHTERFKTYESAFEQDGRDLHRCFAGHRSSVTTRG